MTAAAGRLIRLKPRWLSCPGTGAMRGFFWHLPIRAVSGRQAHTISDQLAAGQPVGADNAMSAVAPEQN